MTGRALASFVRLKDGPGVWPQDQDALRELVAYGCGEAVAAALPAGEMLALELGAAELPGDA